MPYSTENDRYKGTIPGSVFSARGIEYFIDAADPDNNMARSPQPSQDKAFYSIQVDVKGKGVKGPAPPADEYRLFSVPLALDNQNPDAVLRNDLGPTTILSGVFLPCRPRISIKEHNLSLSSCLKRMPVQC